MIETKPPSLSPEYIFFISPIIRITLLTLYIALTIPLPFLATVTQVGISPSLLWLGIAIAFIGLFGILSEKVILNEQEIKVTYPRWVKLFLRRGWALSWQEIKQLKLRTTGQGGLVYYFLTEAADKAYLLPMRVSGFARMVSIIEEKTGIDTQDIRPLSQPWMYLILFLFSLLLLLIDIWIIFTANSHQPINYIGLINIIL